MIIAVDDDRAQEAGADAAADCVDTPSPEASTRERVVRTISEQGPITAAELARQLGLTPAAVRRHLDGLLEAGYLQERERSTPARRRGRPARAYVLSDAGHARLSGDYRTFSLEVLGYLAEVGGPDAVEAFARRRATALGDRMPAAVTDESLPMSERVDALVVGLREEGFAASVRPVGQGTALDGVQVCQGHCPVRDAAAQYPQLCEAETEVFADLLGGHVQRLATQAHGDHVCTTFVPLTLLDASSARAVQDLPATERDSR